MFFCTLISVSEFSMIFRNFLAFPGIDIGYRINDNLRLYTNIGYTYRVPTYTDLYYSSPTTIGNEELIPESFSHLLFGSSQDMR